jgi:hypothetical protein
VATRLARRLTLRRYRVQIPETCCVVFFNHSFHIKVKTNPGSVLHLSVHTTFLPHLSLRDPSRIFLSPWLERRGKPQQHLLSAGLKKKHVLFWVDAVLIELEELSTRRVDDSNSSNYASSADLFVQCTYIFFITIVCL